MLLAHKIALDPNAAQRVYFARAAGTARHAYNWALAEWRKQYAVTKCAAQEAVIDLGAAFRPFFEKRSERPKFKRKDGRASFCAASGAARSAPTAGASSCRSLAGSGCAKRSSAAPAACALLAEKQED